MKFVETLITFSEIPDEITLCINISGCPNNCEGCHSPYLKEDVGEELTFEKLEELIKQNDGISCVCFMGGDADPQYINKLGNFVKKHGLKSAWYSGKQELPIDFGLSNFNFIKLGPYVKELGPLTSKSTNQRFYAVAIDSISKVYELIDETYRFQSNNKLN